METKLQLLHGPGIVSSRSKLALIKKQFDTSNIVVFGPESSNQQIIGSLLTPSIFSGERLIILENPKEDLNLDFSGFPDSKTVFIVWVDHEVSSKSQLLEFVKKQNGQVLFFEEGKEVSVFPFLDYLAGKNAKAFLELQKLKIAGFEIGYTLTMVFYLLRNLVCTPKNAPEFVKRKLAMQRLNFGEKDIEKLYKDILEVEFKFKSGLADQPQAEFSVVHSFMD